MHLSNYRNFGYILLEWFFSQLIFLVLSCLIPRIMLSSSFKDGHHIEHPFVLLLLTQLLLGM